jgi:hypothetical protein
VQVRTVLALTFVLVACSKKSADESIPDVPIAGTVGGAPFTPGDVFINHVRQEDKWVIQVRGKGPNVINHPEVSLWLKAGAVPTPGKAFDGVGSASGIGPIQVQLVGEKGPIRKNAEHGHFRLEITKWDVHPPDPKTPADKDLSPSLRRVGKASSKVFIATDDPGGPSRLAGVFGDADVVDELPPS